MFQSAFCNNGILTMWMMACIPSSRDLREGRDAVKRVRQKTRWRYGLTGDRCAAELRRYLDETLRCEATRMHTSERGAVSGSDNLENTAGFRVNLRKWFALFQCSVNWSRARLRIALIADGAQRSRSICAGMSLEQCAFDWCLSVDMCRDSILFTREMQPLTGRQADQNSGCKLHLLQECTIMKMRWTCSVPDDVTTPPATFHLPTGLL